jgi:hypothetical protein
MRGKIPAMDPVLPGKISRFFGPQTGPRRIPRAAAKSRRHPMQISKGFLKGVNQLE